MNWRTGEAINGEEMAALLDYLESYDPADAGSSWADVYPAPETPERQVTAWDSMSAPIRRLLDVLRDGGATLRVNGVEETFAPDSDGLRVPRGPFRDYIVAAGDRRRRGLGRGADVRAALP